MIFNNNHFEFLPYLLHLCALYCKSTWLFIFLYIIAKKSVIMSEAFLVDVGILLILATVERL